MSNWAIVIGINEYWTAGANLTLAVKDALDMTQWLTDKDGGNVPPHNLYLLTSPQAPETYSDGTPLPEEIEKKEATFLSLKNTILDLMSKSNGTGERFYFYFSGHGVINKEFENKQGLLMTDFDQDNPDHSMTLDSITRYFQTINFNEQIFIIDACRSFPGWEGKFMLGRFPYIGEPTSEFTPSQFLLFATAPLLRAAERVKPDETNSAFTKILLEGLKGKGAAKRYHADEEMYHVNVEDLFKYVKTKVEERRIPASGAGSSVYQSPLSDIYGYKGKFPVLAKFDRNAFDEEKLEIHVTPPVVWGEAQIFVSSADSNYHQIIAPVENSPLKLPQKTQRTQKLLPMTYNVQAFAKGFKSRIKPSSHFDLYEPKRIFVEFSADDSEPRSKVPPWIKGRGVESPSRADLTIKSADPLAPLEIRNSNYELITFGQGHLTAPRLKAGLYRARLVLPEGDVPEEIVELRGKDEEITLDAPALSKSTVFNELKFEHQRSVEFYDDNLFNHLYSDSIVIREAASTPALHRMITELPESARARGTGVLCVVMVEREIEYKYVNEYLSRTELRLRQQTDEASEISLNTETHNIANRTAKHIIETAAGNYFLSIKLPHRNAASFSVSVLPARTTLLILHRHPNGKVNVFSFSPAVNIESGGEIQREAENQFRRMELLQRFHINNRVDDTHALEYADALSKTERRDPFAECLAGYTKLLLNKSEELGDLTRRLVERYDALSDSRVLRAEFLASRDVSDTEVKDEYRRALNCGIPIFAEGVKRLVQGVEKYNIEHPRAGRLYEVFDNHTQNILWTSWTPVTTGAAASADS